MLRMRPDGGFEVRRMKDASDASRFCKERPESKRVKACTFKGGNTLVKSSKSVQSLAGGFAFRLFDPEISLVTETALKGSLRLTKGHKGWREKIPPFPLLTGNQGVLT